MRGRQQGGRYDEVCRPTIDLLTAYGAALHLDSPKSVEFYASVVTDSGATRGEVFGLAGSLFEGRFQVEKRIAEGGFAVVYRAWQLTLERWVALKVLKAPRSYDDLGRAEFRQKFADEAKTIARLRHPHIVDVYDFSVSTLPSGELAPWMALEWLDGDTLAVRLRGRRALGDRGLGPREAVDFLRPVIEAVAYAHEQGIAHRDVKPGNIMVTDTAQGPALRVLDFGIAKIMVDDQWPETGQTRTESAPVFSPAYAAPEQVAFSRTGPWTDVHALGLMLTELMTDEAPFSDSDPDAHMFELVMARNRPTPRSKGWDVGLFEPIIAKALALAPRDRWRSAGQLLKALEDAIEGRGSEIVLPESQDPVAPPEPPPARQLQPAKIRWGMASVVVSLACVIGLVWKVGGRKSSQPPGEDRITVSSTATPEPVVARPIERAVAKRPEPVPPAAGASASGITERTTRPPRVASRRKKKASASPSPSSAADGRDLFDDTK
jgi:serine/threonine protein kinase